MSERKGAIARVLEKVPMLLKRLRFLTSIPVPVTALTRPLLSSIKRLQA